MQYSNQFFCDYIKNHAFINKYCTWYLQICQRAYNRAKTKKEAKEIIGYVESHHIVPRSMSSQFSRENFNIVHLTAREHFICHWLATKMFSGSNKRNMIYALHMLTISNKHMKRINCSLQYENVKISNRLELLVEGPHNKGKPQSKDTIEKIKETKRLNNYVPSEGTKRKMSVSHTGSNNHMFGKNHSDSTRKKISDATKGRKAHNKGKNTPTDIVMKMSRSKRSKSKIYIILSKDQYVGQMSIIEFCERFELKYANVYSSASYKGKYFNWRFTPI